MFLTKVIGIFNLLLTLPVRFPSQFTTQLHKKVLFKYKTSLQPPFPSMSAQMSFLQLRNKILATVLAKPAKLRLLMELVCLLKGSQKQYVLDLQRQPLVMTVYVLLVTLLQLTAQVQPQTPSYGVQQVVMLPHLHIKLVTTHVFVTQAMMVQVPSLL